MASRIVRRKTSFALDNQTLIILRNESKKLGISVSRLLTMIAGKIERGEIVL